MAAFFAADVERHWQCQMRRIIVIFFAWPFFLRSSVIESLWTAFLLSIIMNSATMSFAIAT